MTVQSKTTIKAYFETGDKPTQAQFADLVDSYQDFNTSLSAFSSAAGGFIVKTTASAVVARSIEGTSGEVTVADSTGSAGNPVISLPNNLVFSGKTVSGGTYNGVTLNAPAIVSAQLASPNMTGVPTAPTATSSTNTTQIATTEFVQNIVVQKRLASGQINSVSAVSVSGIPSTAEMVEITLNRVSPIVDNVGFIMRVSRDNGSTYDAGASDYAYSYIKSTVGGSLVQTDSTAAASSILLMPSMGNLVIGNGEQGNGTIRIYRPGTSNFCTITAEFCWRDQANGTLNQSHIGAMRLSAAAVNAIQLAMVSGSINTCNYDVVYR